MFQPAKRKESFTSATRELFANPFFVAILWTGILRMAIYQAIQPFIFLYLRDIGVSYTQIGILELVFSIIVIGSILIGSYFSDLIPHKRSWFTGAFSCIWGFMCVVYSFVVDFWWALAVYLIGAFAMAFQPAARAYLLDQSGDKKHFAMGIFSTYRLPLLLIFLLLFWLFQAHGFIQGMKIALFFGGGAMILLGIFRWALLGDPPKNENQTKKKPSFIGLVKDNVETLRFVWRIAPAFVLITIVDSVSDQLYNFFIYFFLNEKTGISETELLVGRLSLDIISIPLILWASFQIGRSNRKNAFFLVYLVPTLTVGLLLVSLTYPVVPFIPNFAPVAFRKLGFWAFSFKYISDFLWVLILAPLAVSFVSEENATKAIGISWLLVHVSRLIASPIAALLYQNYTNGATILLYSIFALNLLILFAIFWQAPTETKIHKLH